MLENENTLDWEKWLPAMMLSYNTNVNKSTKESLFYLTYLHDPHLPFFDMENPKPMYKGSYTTKMIQRLGTAYCSSRENQSEGKEGYYNQKRNGALR